MRGGRQWQRQEKEWVSNPCFYGIVVTLQVRPQERKELCGGREGQTTYYVERKVLRCNPGKATLLYGI